VRYLHDRNGARPADAGNAYHRCKHVQAPRHPANVQLVAGKADHSRQAVVPAVIGLIMSDDVLGADGHGHPLRIGRRTSILGPHSQVRASASATTDLLNGMPEIGGCTVECVEQELVVRDLGRHPIELRVDGRHPVRRHSLSRVSR
jgi:hypothetical protein